MPAKRWALRLPVEKRRPARVRSFGPPLEWSPACARTVGSAPPASWSGFRLGRNLWVRLRIHRPSLPPEVPRCPGHTSVGRAEELRPGPVPAPRSAGPVRSRPGPNRRRCGLISASSTVERSTPGISSSTVPTVDGFQSRPSAAYTGSSTCRISSASRTAITNPTWAAPRIIRWPMPTSFVRPAAVDTEGAGAVLAFDLTHPCVQAEVAQGVPGDACRVLEAFVGPPCGRRVGKGHGHAQRAFRVGRRPATRDALHGFEALPAGSEHGLPVARRRRIAAAEGDHPTGPAESQCGRVARRQPPGPAGPSKVPAPLPLPQGMRLAGPRTRTACFSWL